jgi:hypothetical protein
MLRDSGFWPLTEPPVFSQPGGTVPPGYSLSMTSSVATPGQTAAIHYTLDGSDPRLPGGSLNPAAQLYAAPLALTALCTVKARARNNFTSEWSPLTEATFAPAAVPASATNLVIAEIMYHPPDATAAEEAADFDDADDFEFVRLLNIAPVPVDLAGVRFTDGIVFDFTSGARRYLNPGASVLVVANLAAFQLRYGHGCDDLIAGLYAGRLANSGERLLLVDASGATLRELTYADGPPWPPAADGDGPSLILIDPATNPDHANPANWTPSVMPGGMPSGSIQPQSYTRWRELYWAPAAATNDLLSGPAADYDADSLDNFIEYAFGLDPRRASLLPAPAPALEWIGDQRRLTLSLRVAPGAADAQLYWEASPDLVDWAPADPPLELLETVLGADGSARCKYAEPASALDQPARFLRPRLNGVSP